MHLCFLTSRNKSYSDGALMTQMRFSAHQMTDKTMMKLMKQMHGHHTTNVFSYILQLHLFSYNYIFSKYWQTVFLGRVMVPFQSMVGHFLYYNNQNRNELTKFNWIGASPSYNSVRGARNLLKGCELELSDNNVPVSTNFTRTSSWVHLIMLIILKSPPWLVLIAAIMFPWCCSKMQVRNH